MIFLMEGGQLPQKISARPISIKSVLCKRKIWNKPQFFHEKNLTHKSSPAPSFVKSIITHPYSPIFPKLRKINAVTVFGYLVDFFMIFFSVFSLTLVSFEKMYQTLKTVFDFVSKPVSVKRRLWTGGKTQTRAKCRLQTF